MPRLLAMALLVLPLLGCGGGRSPVTADAQIGFGVRMAERGLWSEALFRFERARQLGGGSDARLLNNLAVASEALGRFEEALGYYRQALALAPGDRDLKANYDRFVSFYESYRAAAKAGETQAGAPPAEPAADSGSPGPATMPGGDDPPLVPGAGDPQPPGPRPAEADDPPPQHGSSAHPSLPTAPGGSR